MTNIQLYLSIGLPILTVLIGFILNWRMLANFRPEVNQRFDDVNRRVDHVDAELSTIRQHLLTFYSITGVLQGRLDELSKTS